MPKRILAVDGHKFAFMVHRSCLKFIRRFPHVSFWLHLRWIFRRRGLRLWLQNPPCFAQKYPMGNSNNKI